MTDKPRCIWIWGPSGSGKNKWIYTHFKSIYPKSLDRWWNFYHGEEVVCIDNIVKGCRFIPSIMCIAKKEYKLLKVKGGKPVKPNYIWFFITSVYSIDECLKNSIFRDEMKEIFEEYYVDDLNKLII